MVTAEVLADDEEYAEVIQDLHEECGKYGAIRAVHVPRPPNPKVLAASVFGTGTYGKVGPVACVSAQAPGRQKIQTCLSLADRISAETFVHKQQCSGAKPTLVMSPVMRFDCTPDAGCGVP